MKKIYLTISIFLISFTLSSQENISTDNSNDTKTTVEDKTLPAKPAATPIDFKLAFAGNHTFEFRIPVMPNGLDYTGPIKSPKFKNDIGAEIQYKFLRVVTHWEVDAYVNDTGDVTTFLGGNVYPRENSIVISPWKIRLGAGFQYFDWGESLLAKPTDNVNSKDFTGGAQIDKLSVMSVFFSIAPVDFASFEVIYLPFAQGIKFPFDYISYFEDEFGIADVYKTNPSFDPSSFKIATKAAFKFKYVRFSLSYIYDMDPFFEPKVTTVYNPTTQIYDIESMEMVAKRLQRFGADIKGMYNKFSWWAEVSYNMTEDYTFSDVSTRNPQFAWTTGFSFSYGLHDLFFFSLQYTGTFVPLFDTTATSKYNYDNNGNVILQPGRSQSYYDDYYYNQSAYFLANIREGLLQGFLIIAAFPFFVAKDFLLRPNLAVVYNFPLMYDTSASTRYGNMYINPEFNISPMPALNFAIGADLFFAWMKKPNSNVVEIDYDDKMGMFNTSSSIYFKITYNWGFNFLK